MEGKDSFPELERRSTAMKLGVIFMVLAFAASTFAQVVYTDEWRENELVYAGENDRKIEEPTAFRIRNTDTAFDVEVRLEGTHWKRLQSVPFKMEPVGWPREESVELFFDPGRRCTRYLQIAAGVNGGVFDKRFSAQKWNAKWTVTRQDFEGGVVLKFHIPYDQDFRKPAKGEVWGFNLCRNVKGDSSHFSTFAKVGAAFNNPSKFAELRLCTQKEFASITMQRNLIRLGEVRREIERCGLARQFETRLSELEKGCTEMDIRLLQDEIRMLKAMKEMDK